MENTKGVSLQDYWALLRRRRFFIAWVFLAVLLVVSLVALSLPEKYRSSALIYIERPDIREDLVRTTVASYDTDLRIDRMTQLVLSRDNLEELIEELGLYPDLPPEERSGALRSDVDVDKVANANQTSALAVQETIGFQVAFKHESPEIAQSVASRLADLFILENAASRTATVTETTLLLEQQARALLEELARTEATRAQFKIENAGSLPEDSAFNQQMLDRAERDLEGVERELRSVQSRKELLLSQLAQTSPSATLYDQNGDPILGIEDRLETLRRQYLELAARYSPEHPDLVRIRNEIDLLAANHGAPTVDRDAVLEEIEAKHAELADLRRRYAEDHPDVRRLQSMIAELNRRLIEAPASSGRRTSLRPPNNPAYIELQVQLDSAELELTALRADRERLRQRIEDYQARISREPEVERQLATLTRDYEVARQEYNEIREKQAEAQRAVAVEDGQKAERYVLQRAAYLPESPAQPTRLTIILAGMFLAMTAAIGVALLRDGVDATVRDVRDLRMITNTPPMAMIPLIMNDRQTWLQRAKQAALAVSYAGVAYLVAAAVA